MKDPFKSDNYRENLGFLKEAIKARDELVTIRHYNKTVRDLSQALKRFTDKAEDVAKFVIRGDSIDYVKSMNGRPSILKILKGILNRIFGRNIPVKNISSFIDKLPPPTSMTIFEYLEACRKISGLEQVERGNIAIAPEKPERSFLKEDRQVDVNYNDSGHGNSLDEKPGYKEISNYQEKKSKILTENSQSSKSSKEEPIYATVPKKHIEAKRELKQKQQSKPPILPKPSIAPPLPKKMFAAGQEVRQKPKVVGTVPKSTKDKPELPPKLKNLGHTDQKSSTKLEMVVSSMEKDKPKLPPKLKNLGHADQKSSTKLGMVVSSMEKEINYNIDIKVQEIRKKFKQNQAKENPNAQTIESRTTPVAQVNIDVEKKTRPSPKVASQSRLFPMGDEISQMNLLSAKSDPRPHVSKSALLTDVNVKQIVVQFENYGRKVS
ncbi:hypothetical protein ACJZL1_03645 [Wolbachia endosymbiont of Rhagoletis indifferens]|uniref:hypothetical protein n=1 Tax=Wolbachia endosymbiont of Rhagoletis indifferens TaxID=3383250 RepID=UPI003AF35143